MRYYNIVISDPDTGKVIRQFTSHPNEKFDPGALMVEMDIPVAPFATPLGNTFVRIWGISIQIIGQACDLNAKVIQVYGGMQKGLPLANPAQSGLLVEGLVFQAFGNWQGNNMTLDLIITSGAGSANNPRNIIFNWQKGTPLASAIQAALNTAFPGCKQTINIDPKVVLNNDEFGCYESMSQFAGYLKGLSQSIIGGEYGGIEIFIREDQFFIFDRSTKKTPKLINFSDMVGQPTWTGPGTIQVTCVMRGDLNIDDYLKLPPSQVTNTSQSFAKYRQASIFQGIFHVNSIRHVGNSRQPDGRSWVTVIDLNAEA